MILPGLDDKNVLLFLLLNMHFMCMFSTVYFFVVVIICDVVCVVCVVVFVVCERQPFEMLFNI